jgi:hypothetical protein
MSTTLPHTNSLIDRLGKSLHVEHSTSPEDPIVRQTGEVGTFDVAGQPQSS